MSEPPKPSLSVLSNRDVLPGVGEWTAKQRTEMRASLELMLDGYERVFMLSVVRDPDKPTSTVVFAHSECRPGRTGPFELAGAIQAKLNELLSLALEEP